MQPNPFAGTTISELAHATAIIGAVADPQDWTASLQVSPHDTIAINARDTNGIKEVREFASGLLLSPQFGEWRLGIIYYAQHLTPQAQNALLKLLEEPPQNVKLLLFIETESTVLPTVLSRCRKVFIADGGVAHEEKSYNANTLEQFMQAEELAKDGNLTGIAYQWLHNAYESWCKSGRPVDQLSELTRFWDFYKSLETQIGKRLLIEKLVLSSL